MIIPVALSSHLGLLFPSLFLLFLHFAFLQQVNVVNLGLKIDIVENVGENLIIINIFIKQRTILLDRRVVTKVDLDFRQGFEIGNREG